MLLPANLRRIISETQSHSGITITHSAQIGEKLRPAPCDRSMAKVAMRKPITMLPESPRNVLACFSHGERRFNAKNAATAPASTSSILY